MKMMSWNEGMKVFVPAITCWYQNPEGVLLSSRQPSSLVGRMVGFRGR